MSRRAGQGGAVEDVAVSGTGARGESDGEGDDSGESSEEEEETEDRGFWFSCERASSAPAITATTTPPPTSSCAVLCAAITQNREVPLEIF